MPREAAPARCPVSSVWLSTTPIPAIALPETGSLLDAVIVSCTKPSQAPHRDGLKQDRVGWSADGTLPDTHMGSRNGEYLDVGTHTAWPCRRTKSGARERFWGLNSAKQEVPLCLQPHNTL